MAELNDISFTSPISLKQTFRTQLYKLCSSLYLVTRENQIKNIQTYLPLQHFLFVYSHKRESLQSLLCITYPNKSQFQIVAQPTGDLTRTIKNRNTEVTSSPSTTTLRCKNRAQYMSLKSSCKRVLSLKQPHSSLGRKLLNTKKQNKDSIKARGRGGGQALCATEHFKDRTLPRQHIFQTRSSHHFHLVGAVLLRTTQIQLQARQWRHG